MIKSNFSMDSAPASYDTNALSTFSLVSHASHDQQERKSSYSDYLLYLPGIMLGIYVLGCSLNLISLPTTLYAHILNGLPMNQALLGFAVLMASTQRSWVQENTNNALTLLNVSQNVVYNQLNDLPHYIQLLDQSPLVYSLRRIPLLLTYGHYGIQQVRNHATNHPLPYVALSSLSLSHIMGSSVYRFDLGLILASQLTLMPFVQKEERSMSLDITSTSTLLCLASSRPLEQLSAAGLTWLATVLLTYPAWQRNAIKNIWFSSPDATQRGIINQLQNFEHEAQTHNMQPFISLQQEADRHLGHPADINGKDFFHLVLKYLTNTPIAYIRAAEIDSTTQTNAWQLKKLQNLFYFLQELNADDGRPYDIFQVLHFAFNYLQSLYLRSGTETVAYYAHDAKTMASILHNLKLYTRTADMERDPDAYRSTLQDGLQVALGASNLMAAILKNNHKKNKFGDALNELSIDLNIALQMVDAYLLNHDATINHLIFRGVYIFILYATFATIIALCVSNAAVMPVIATTLIASLIAIPVLTTLFCLLAPNFLQYKSFAKSLRQLDELADTRGVESYDRASELGHIINYVASTSLYYENLVIKILYGMIFSALVVSAVAIPILFLSLHVLPSLAGIFTAIVIVGSAYQFFMRKPKPHKADSIKLNHGDETPVVESMMRRVTHVLGETEAGNSLFEKTVLSLFILLNPLYQSEAYEDVISNLSAQMPTQIALCLSRLLPLDHAISKAVAASIPLWRQLDLGTRIEETHLELANIWKDTKNSLNRNDPLSEDLSHIIEALITIHELEIHSPQNFVELASMLIRFSLPHLPRLLARSGIISHLFKSMASTCYPTLDSAIIEKYSKQLEAFLAANSNHETAWLKSLATFTQAFLREFLPADTAPELAYRSAWEAVIIESCERILRSEPSTTLANNPYITLIQGFIEIYQDGISRKLSLSERDIQFRATLRYFSIMLEDGKRAEEEQYEFVDHYQYCWKQIPHIYFLVIITVSLLIFMMTPLSFSLPIVISALLGGLLLMPWLTQQTKNNMEARGDQFGNLIDVSHQANETTKKHDSGNLFLSSFLSQTFNQLGQIFSTARGSLFNLATVIVLFGLLSIGLLCVFFAHLNPMTMVGIAAIFFAVAIACCLHERLFTLPTFKHYEYKEPGQPTQAAQLFTAAPTPPRAPRLHSESADFEPEELLHP